MRVTAKLVSLVSALVLTVALVGFVGSPAQAAKPKHDLSGVFGGETAKGQFYISGKIPTLIKKNVTIQKKPKGKSYTFYKKTKTNGKGKFLVNIDGRIGDCFKLIAPKTKDNRKSSVVVGCIVRA
jgi:hypothetical protein